MPSTYSTNLALELIGTGGGTGTWGDTTNSNLGTLIEQAISGYVTQAMGDADQTITIPDGVSGVARNMFIECTGTLTAARNLIVPINKKLYFVYNNTMDGFAITVKVLGQTGVSVANGRKMVLVSNGTDVVAAVNYFISPTFVTPALGTPASGTLTNCTGFLVPNGALGTPSSGTLTNCTGYPGDFPAGTRLIFQQTNAPTGWTKDTTGALNDSALRIVTGSVGSGGTAGFTTAFASRTPTGSVTVNNHTLTTAEMPAHTHDSAAGPGPGSPNLDPISAITQQLAAVGITTGSTGGGGAHSHGGSFSGSAMDFAVKYNDVIIATKD